MLKLKKSIINLIVLVLTILNLLVYSENEALSYKTLGNNQIHIDKLKKQNNVLILDGTKNTRYLGIYNDVEGNSLNYEAFLRYDNTGSLTENDLKKLKELNVKTVIDLRYPNEIKKIQINLQI